MNSHSLYFLARLYTISEGFSTLLPTPVMLPPSTLNWPSGELPELWSDEKPKALPDCWPLLPPPTPPLRPKRGIAPAQTILAARRIAAEVATGISAWISCGVAVAGIVLISGLVRVALLAALSSSLISLLAERGRSRIAEAARAATEASSGAAAETAGAAEAAGISEGRTTGAV